MQAVCGMQVLEQRVETLERELDAAISAAARARAEKRQAEAAQKAAELRAHEITRELENTTSMCTKSSFSTTNFLLENFFKRCQSEYHCFSNHNIE